MLLYIISGSSPSFLISSALSYSCYFKVPSPRSKRHFSFLNPLADDIWLYMLGSYILVSITMWIVARFSPLEWKERELCDECLLEAYTSDFQCSEHSCDCSSGIGSDTAWNKRDVHYNDDTFSSEPFPVLEVRENDFTAGNSFWFGIGTLMQQGSDLNPKVQYFRLDVGLCAL